MTVVISALDDDLEGLDGFWDTFTRVTTDIVTGGAAELYWNKTARKAITTGAKAIGRTAQTVGKAVGCPVARAFDQKNVTDAAMKSGYGVAAVAAARGVKALCGKSAEEKVEEKKKEEEKKKVEEVAKQAAAEASASWWTTGRTTAVVVGGGVVLLLFVLAVRR
jgi:ribosomal protein L12E/L44/L45/RPP1/RPP2